MKCTNCGTQNDDSFRFCMKCGIPLTAATPAAPEAVPVPPAGAQQEPLSPMHSAPPVPQAYPQQPPPAYNQPQPPNNQPQPAQPYPQQPAAQPYPQQQPAPTYQQPSQGQAYNQQPQPTYMPAPSQQGGQGQPPVGPVYGQPGYQPMPVQRPQPPGYYQQQPYMRDSTSLINIWGPFAGFGTRRKHMGWLLDNRGDCANQLIESVQKRFTSRQIEGVTVSQETLIARGIFVEMRTYFLLRKRLASVGLYINNFGKDLYLSIVTYLKPPISNVRTLLLIVSVLFWLYTSLILPAAITNEFEDLVSGVSSSMFGGNASAGGDSLMLLLCLIGPAGFINSLALFIFVVYSIYKWVTEKDILSGLRTTPNEFNEDDLMAMEKAAEQTVRMAMDDLGIDATNLRPVSPNQPSRVF